MLIAEIRRPVRRTHQRHGIVIAQGPVYSFLGALHLVVHLPDAQVGQVRVVVGVVSKRMPLLRDAPKDLGVPRYLVAEDKERGFQVMFPQDVEYGGCNVRVWPVVEGEGNLSPVVVSLPQHREAGRGIPFGYGPPGVVGSLVDPDAGGRRGVQSSKDRPRQLGDGCPRSVSEIGYL